MATDQPFIVKNSLVVNTGFTANATVLTLGNTSINVSINSTSFTGTSNNTLYVGATAANLVVSNAQLQANLSNYYLASNPANYVSSVSGLTVNNANYLGGNSAANLIAFAANAYSNAVSYIGSLPLVNTSQLSSNLSNYQTTAGLASSIAVLTSNNTLYVGSIAAANVVSSTQLSSNLSNYQTTAGLSANVGMMTSNNSTNFAGQGQSFYANTSSPQFTTGLSVGNTTSNIAMTNTSITVGNGYVQSLLLKTTAVSANYSISSVDSGTLLAVNSASNVYITIPATMPTESRLMVLRLGTGNVNISNAASLILGSRTGNYSILNQYGSISIYLANSTLAICDGNI